MKKQFAEYYNLPDERIKEIWDNSLIVLDTNVLLNLYRYNEEARNDFINALKSYEGRLWIPYQVGLEFHRRRETIMRKNAEAYDVWAIAYLFSWLRLSMFCAMTILVTPISI